jgi:Phage tail protein (Tail_P2_I)
MARPTVSNIAEEMYEGLEPLAYADNLNQWSLLHFCEAFIGKLQQVEDIVRDDQTIDAPGWSIVLDVDRAPYVGLPWLGQFVGVTTPEPMVGETQAQHDARTRAYIRATGGFNRGTPAAVVGAVQQYLTGTKSVFLIERDSSAYHFIVRVRTSQATVDAATFRRAIDEVKPAGLQYVFEMVPDWTYDELNARAATYNALDAMYSTYNQMEGAP